MRFASLNLRAYPNHNRIRDLAALIARHEPDVLLLQECRRAWLDVVLGATGLIGVHSHDVDEPLATRPPDGCAIAVRKPLVLSRSWRLPPERFDPEAVAQAIQEPTPPGHATLPPGLACRFSARTLFAEVQAKEGIFVAAALHATPGTSRAGIGWRQVSEWKPFFHGAVALELAELAVPFVFAIDANEPRSETLDHVRFHWTDGRAGVLKFEALLGLRPMHRGRDLLRDYLAQSSQPAEAADFLALTYTTRGGGLRRFDHLWATNHFAIGGTDDEPPIRVHYQDALAAGTDHALLVADLDVRHDDTDTLTHSVFPTVESV